ncbi:MAG TPA: hypothetical protein VFU49_24850 [Ktedonobacteraceae bacterium]|nr:hypothetical protein [Ktedonobacteraceae bacterium]
MAKRRVRGRAIKAKLPCLTFTLEQLVVLRKALVPFEQMILTQKHPLPNADFALETVKHVQAKIQRMITLAAWRESVAFDANEMLILQASVWIFALSLEARERSAERDTLKQQCQTLSSLFNELS